MHQIAVYSQCKSPRLSYVLNFLMERFGLELKVYTDMIQFKNYTGPKINYSTQNLNGLTIHPHAVLFEKNIHFFDFNGLENDPFALIFFLLSRYEEYIIKDRDVHNRFQAKNSYLHKKDRLQIPVVDVLVQQLKTNLLEAYPELKFTNHQYETQLTIDIDQAFLYKHKTIKRILGGHIRDTLLLNLKGILHRPLSVLGLIHDPYDVFEKLKTKYISSHMKPIFFFQVGDYSKFDKNLNFKNRSFQKVIQKVGTWTEVGLHPSYASNTSQSILMNEKNRLSQILQKKITKSRQHYIKLDLPSTYHNLIQAEIQSDFSMGFADNIGFRAGTSRSFLWYDLEKESQTELRVFPFSAMDVTLKNYLELDPRQADVAVSELQNNIKKVNGMFTFIAHNESLSNYGKWKGWQQMILNWVS